VDGSVSEHQGPAGDVRRRRASVFRLSGTGTSGATLRVYLERFEPDPSRHAMETADALADIVAAAEELAGVRARTGRDRPDVIT
jgi:phosphoglucomutase